jgi:hypothetical protein
MTESSEKVTVSQTPKASSGSFLINTQPVLNGKYALMNRLGEGNTSKVYLA